MEPEQLQPVEVEARDGHTLWVRYNDGVEGEINLAPQAGQGVFKVWDEPGVFESMSITPYRAIRWTEDAELCADAVYLELTGKEPEEIMPGLGAYSLHPTRGNQTGQPDHPRGISSYT